MVKTDLQCMFNMPQTGYFGWPKVQIKSCVYQTDFFTPQFVKNSPINVYIYIYIYFNSFHPHKLELVGLDEFSVI